MTSEITFIETIRVENGKINNLDLHVKRSSDAIQRHFGMSYVIPFEQLLEEHFHKAQPQKKQPQKEGSLYDGVYKFRVVYSNKVLKHTLTRYSPQPLKTLKMIECNNIEYGYKYEDRSRIESLRALRGACDDILIIKNGFVTDTSYGNLLFKLKTDNNLYTPDTFLLNGTKREYMLTYGIISERELRIENISECESFYMINAMVEPTLVTVEF